MNVDKAELLNYEDDCVIGLMSGWQLGDSGTGDPGYPGNQHTLTSYRRDGGSASDIRTSGINIILKSFEVIPRRSIRLI